MTSILGRDFQKVHFALEKITGYYFDFEAIIN